MYSLRHLHSPQLKINAPGCITVGKQTWNVNHHQNLKKAHGHFFCHFKKKTRVPGDVDAQVSTPKHCCIPQPCVFL